MKVKVKNNGDTSIFTGDSPEEIVAQMNAEQWPDPSGKERRNAEYMRQAAARGKIHPGVSVRSDTAEHYLQDLAAAGLIEIT